MVTSSEKALITTFPIICDRTSPTPFGQRPEFLLSGTNLDAINGDKNESSFSMMHVFFISNAIALGRLLPASP